MDDCNALLWGFTECKWLVQIPLWTIVTRLPAQTPPGRCMVQIPLWTIVTKAWDKWTETVSGVQIPLWTIVTSPSTKSTSSKRRVQIPLWTIVTGPRHLGRAAQKSSDSSMDDCNPDGTIAQQVGVCSDSSMDDCNNQEKYRKWREKLFRFLYGRL